MRLEAADETGPLTARSSSPDLEDAVILMFSHGPGFPWHWVVLTGHEPSILLQKCSPTDCYGDDDGDDDDEKAFRSRSAARPGEIAPLVTLSSR